MRLIFQIVLSLFALPSLAMAGPEKVQFQGAIDGLAGHEVIDGPYIFRVDVYDVAEGGIPLYSQGDVTAEVSSGAFSIVLAPSVPGTLGSAFADNPRFVEITVVSDPNGAPINQTLFPRREISSAPFTLSDVPAGAIILWIRGPTCPDGFAEMEAFRNLLVRGADGGGENAAVPDVPGEVCPGGAGCGAAPERYDDVLQVEELAAHSHGLTRGFAPGGDVAYPGIQKEPLDKTIETSTTGGDQPHYHPFATVLFCRKQR